MSPFVHFDLDLDFQCHMLQGLDGQTQCDHFDENRLIGVGDIQRVYCCPGDQFSPEKWRLSCAATSVHAANFNRSRICWS